MPNNDGPTGRSSPPELRIALTVDDFDSHVRFFRDGLGLDPGDLWTDGGHGQMFRAGRASLEVFDHDYAESVDRLEVGEPVSGPVRLAVEVPDVDAALEQALRHGASLVSPPKMMPWNDRNARIRSPEGLQITLYEVKGTG